MTNEKMEQIVKLLKDSGEDYILCYPLKIDGEDGFSIASKTASTSYIKIYNRNEQKQRCY